MTKSPKHDDFDELEAEERDDSVIGVAFRWSLLVICAIAMIIIIAVFISREKIVQPEIIDRAPIAPPANLSHEEATRPEVRFSDITAAAGIDFTHVSGATGEKLLPETMGSGAAFFDYDNDGDQDLLLVNATHWPGSRVPGAPPTSALYRNSGDGRFENVTQGSGLDRSIYGTGIACGDFDNDGDQDVFIAALGTNQLFRNDSGHFQEVGVGAGVAGEPQAWSTSAGFFDYDNDGLLDLFVCNYVAWTKELDLQLNFSINGTDRAYGPPINYQGAFPYLYRNNGDGTFSDVSETTGIQTKNPATGTPMGKALAVTFADLDRDGLAEIIVANDTVQNFLFHNLNGKFEEYGSASGLAFDQMGSATGAMGMDAADYANRGTLGVGIANFANESTSLYVQQTHNPLLFTDMANVEGIGSPSRLSLSFGLFFFDYDLDGRLDMLQANGHLEDEINQIQPSQFYRQPAQLFWNRGNGASSTFVEVPKTEVGDMSRPMVGRGAAYADIDGDGDLDVLITQTGGPPLLLRNEQDLGHHWLRVRLMGSSANRDGIGAWITLSAGGTTQRRQVMPTRSYLSQVELPVTFGLGTATEVTSLTILWPGGQEQTVSVEAVDTTLTINQP